MVVETEFTNFLEWFLPNPGYSLGAFVEFFLVASVLIVGGVIWGYMVCSVRLGPTEGFYAVAKTVLDGVPDIIKTSPRRTWAIAKLAIQESIRRRVLLASFTIFALALLISGWYLDTKSDHPERVYLGFVVWGTQLLTLILVFLLSAFSLPTDIKNKTIYTVVTKPVRKSEIVLGRMVGFGAIGTVLLLMMGSIGYLFVVRGLSHSHTISVEDLKPAPQDEDESSNTGDLVGLTTRDAGHRHTLTVKKDGTITTDFVQGHDHLVDAIEDKDGNVSYRIGPPEGIMMARVPKYGRLQFLDRRGLRKAVGVNVGDEWNYRSYIEGGEQSLATAVWTFSGIHEGMFPDDVLPLEMTLGVFRTHKGDIKSPIHGEIKFRHPTKNLESVAFGFDALEFQTLQKFIPRKMKVVDENGDVIDADLYQDLVDEKGKVEIRIRCNERAQYFGMAQADLYLRAKNNLFVVNFGKAYFSIWLQMLIVVALGVMFSTFLSTAVSLLATISFTGLGFFVPFVRGLASGEIMGGGPIESLIRIVTQKNVMVEFDENIGTRVVGAIDSVLLFFMDRATYIAPEYNKFNTSNYLAYGFDINGQMLMMHFAIAFGFLVGLTVVSYFFLKAREIAA